MRFNLTLIFLIILTGCSASKVTLQSKDAIQIRSVAILPTSYPGTVARERVEYLRNALRAQLKSDGYLVLDDQLIKRVCNSAPDCPGKDALFKAHGVDGVFKFEVDSYSESNFLAGYVHTLKATVSLADAQGKELFKIEHAIDDKGGLLFNSSQLVEAVTSQAKYGGSAGFAKIADDFVRTLASKLPSPGSSPSENEEFGSGIMVANVRTKEIKPAVFEICATATPKMIGILSLGSSRTTLREIKNGEYCGIFRIEGNDPAKSLFVEIRSPYGEASRQTVSLTFPSPCPIDGRVYLRGGKLVELSCVDVGNGKLPVECNNNTLSCSPQRFNTYAASSDVGPYRKVKEARTTTWTLPQANSNAIIEVLAIDERGVTSQPARAKEETTKEG